ncbi:MAG: hypothetical protein ACE5FS_08485, partial [Paracoccaceae bacterium]
MPELPEEPAGRAGTDDCSLRSHPANLPANRTRRQIAIPRHVGPGSKGFVITDVIRVAIPVVLPSIGIFMARVPYRRREIRNLSHTGRD